MKKTAAKTKAKQAGEPTASKDVSGKEPVLLSGGNPQIAKADGDAPVQAYIAAMPDWKRDMGRRLDTLIERAAQPGQLLRLLEELLIEGDGCPHLRSSNHHVHQAQHQMMLDLGITRPEPAVLLPLSGTNGDSGHESAFLTGR